MSEQTTPTKLQEAPTPDVKPVREVTDVEVLIAVANASHDIQHDIRELLKAQLDTQKAMFAEQQKTNELLSQLKAQGFSSGSSRTANSLNDVMQNLLNKK